MPALALPRSAPLEATMSAAAVGALRCALQAQLRHPSSDGSRRQVLRLLCDDARERGMQVEQVIILLKQAWLSLPEIRAPGGGLHSEQLSRIVGLCIEEYYASRD